MKTGILNRTRGYGFLLPAVLAGALLVSCAGVPAAYYDEETAVEGTEAPEAAVEEATGINKTLVEGAYHIKHTQSLKIRDRTFNWDCTGTVLAIYYYAGIDLLPLMAGYSGNGVSRLYKALADRGLLYATEYPKPGDIIFWDDTWDRNEDGRWNDPLTHTGMVVHTSRWGTIDYVHLNYRKGIVFERMNLKEPDVNRRQIEGELVVINSPMRMRGEPEGEKWLASHLYNAFGRGYALP
mgnify:CR=1 FL=1